jgi:hypothetical protein
MLADARDLFGDHGRTHPRNRYCPTESLYPPQARCSSRPGNSRVSNKLSSKFDSQTLPRHAATSNLASTQQKQNMFKRRRYTHLPRQGHKSFVVYTLTPKFLEVRILPGVSRQLSESKDSGEGKGYPGRTSHQNETRPRAAAPSTIKVFFDRFTQPGLLAIPSLTTMLRVKQILATRLPLAFLTFQKRHFALLERF